MGTDTAYRTRCIKAARNLIRQDFSSRAHLSDRIPLCYGPVKRKTGSEAQASLQVPG